MEDDKLFKTMLPEERKTDFAFFQPREKATTLKVNPSQNSCALTPWKILDGLWVLKGGSVGLTFQSLKQKELARYCRSTTEMHASMDFSGEVAVDTAHSSHAPGVPVPFVSMPGSFPLGLSHTPFLTPGTH
jgi:hypothetical protein